MFSKLPGISKHSVGSVYYFYLTASLILLKDDSGVIYKVNESTVNFAQVVRYRFYKETYIQVGLELKKYIAK